MDEERGTKPYDNMQDISILSTQLKRNLASWGLPDTILKNYEMSGVVSMFPWQVECLSNPRVLGGGNLIYSAPTSAGKTLVAEILTIKTILEKKKKVIIILPFVSVVREKMFYFQDLLSSSGVRVEGLMGSHSLPGGFKSVDIAICTIEKANSLINRLLEEGSLNKVGAVVVDELHLLGDPFRGYLLELLLTKILYMCTVEDSVKIQVVGMSATIPNLALLATWLGADLYQTDFRPVPLKEFLKIGPSVYDSQMNKLYDMHASKYIQDDPDHIVQLCLETLTNGYSVLAFCATKNWCEKLAQHVAKMFRTIGLSGSELGQQLREQLDSNAIAEALEQLQRCPVGLDKVLRCTVAFGVAFHHAGLTVEERDILEGYFRSGAVRVLVATSTLSSGVNLPARRVIVRSPIFHGKSLDSQTYRQMIGRAGRMGRDTAGESFLICNKAEGHIGEKLIGADLKPIESCLGHGELAASLKRAILEVIASGVACTPEQVTQYTNCTLLAATKSNLQNPISACVQFLVANELIRLQEDEEDAGHKYVPTLLGLGCLAASLPPDEGLLLFDELQRARQCFVLDTELHIIYEVLNQWEQLSPAMRRVGELVGIDERFMVRAMRGTLSLSSSKQLQKMSVHRRFYTALALHDLVNEVPLAVVATKFGCSRGMLQSLQQSAATFAGMVTAFCRRLRWSSLELLVSQFQDRLQFGVQRELCDLMRLDGLNGLRARALFDAGICTIADLAAADECAVENALHKAVPFQSCRELDGETSFDTKQRKKLRNVWITGRQGLTEREAASLLIYDSRSFLQKELGLADAKWDNEESDISGHDSQSPSKQSIHSEQEQYQLHDKTSKCPEQTTNQLSTSCRLQLSPLLLKKIKPKMPHSDINKRLTEQERRNSLCCILSGYKMQKIGETKFKYLSSELSNEDYVSSSPLLKCSQNKSSQMCTSQKLRSRLGKAKNSKILSGSISQNASAKRSICKSKKVILSKELISETFTAGKQYQAVPIITNQLQCNKMDNSNSRTVNSSLSKESRYEENLLSSLSALNETPENSMPVTNKVNQSIDYFGSPLEISESKLHEKTQQFKQNNKPEISNKPSSENLNREVTTVSNVCSDKEQCLRTSLSSFRITNNTPIKNNEHLANICPTDEYLLNYNMNQELELLKKDTGELDHKTLDQNRNTSLGVLCEGMETKEKNILTETNNKRVSSDLFSSPISGGNCILHVEGDNQSPVLFGDSLVMDTQLIKLLDGCCNEHQTIAEGICQNLAQDYNKKSSTDHIIQQVPDDVKDEQCLISVSKCGNSFSQGEHIKNGRECHKHIEESNPMGSLVSHSDILNSAKLAIEDVVNELHSCEAEVKDKMKENISFKKQSQFHTLSKGTDTAHNAMKLRNNEGEMLGKITSSSVYHPESESLELSAASNIVRDSMGRKGILVNLSSSDSTDKEVSDPQSVYSEEIQFCSVDEQTAISPIKYNFKTKKGLVSPATYHLNEKLQGKMCKSNTPLKETLRRKRKTSISSDFSYSESEFSNRKRKRVSNKCKIAGDESEVNCVETELSVLNENGNAEYWLHTNMPPKGQHPDKQVHFINENQGVNPVRVNGMLDAEDADCITDSFFERAFDTYWDLDSKTAEPKREDKISLDLGLDKVGTSTGETSTLRELRVLIPPSVSTTQTHNKPDTKDEVTSADSSSLSQRLGDNSKGGKNVSLPPFIISNSFLEAAFNTTWEEKSECKEIKKEIDHVNQNVNSDARSNIATKGVDAHSNLRHQHLSFDNKGTAEQSSSKEKKSGCGRRRSPRLLSAAANKEKGNSCGSSVETVAKMKNSRGSLDAEEHNNCQKTHSLVPSVYPEVLKSKTRSISKKLDSGETLHDCRSQSHLERQNYNTDFPSSPCHVETEFIASAEPIVKELNSSPVHSPTVCRTKENKILQFSSDISDVEAEDDLITSSQGCEDSERKRGSGRLGKVRWKMSGRDIRSASKSPSHSSQQPSRALNPVSKHVMNEVHSRKTIMWDSINIVYVCGHERVWAAFQSELTSIHSSTMTIAVACERLSQLNSSESINSARIGDRIIGRTNKKLESTTQKKTTCYEDRIVSGIALCFGGKDVFYISLKQGDQNCVDLQCKLDLIQDLLARKHVCAFDLKEHVKALARCCGVMVDLTTGHDPKVADWLLEPEGREKNLHSMVLKYCGSSAGNIADLLGSYWGVGSPALDWRSPTSARLRACVEAALTWELVQAQHVSLEEKKLHRIYTETEMPALLCLAQMELNGIGFNRDEAERLHDVLKQQLKALEQHAYKLVGHTFSLTSSANVRKVLYRELGLTTSKLSSKYRCPSTSKEALMQIKQDHPLAGLILQWRKLNALVTKTLYPLLAPGQTSERMFTSSVIHTATGRISMHEPNLQNIPRDFEIVIDETKAEVPISISMRSAFVPGQGKVFVSADYCQLELRLLAHLAKDSILCSILNSDSDVFRRVAAIWNQISETDVTTEQRQWAKQVCYGMIYGMGAKALGEQLEVEEKEAALFMDSFKNAYPGVKQFLLDTVAHCRKKGYAETLFGRRRYLPAIHSPNAAVRAQAERQAINSTVQGSAADIAKKGMVLVQSQLRNMGYTSLNPVASLALHLHDELLYEVCREGAMEVAQRIQTALENAVSLAVRLPVKMKIGDTWGSLQEITL